MPSRAELDAVTVDAFGTTVELLDPVGPLRRALARRGVVRGREAVARGSATEADYYVRHSLRGRDGETLSALRRDCTSVFLRAVGSDLDPAEFAPDYVAALRFRPVGGAADALDTLRSAGLRLACVGNWDLTLEEVLRDVGVVDRFDVVVSSALARAEKPDPAIFHLALERLGVPACRALHIGDRDDTDRAGARAAGVAFEPAPLATLPARLGLA